MRKQVISFTISQEDLELLEELKKKTGTDNASDILSKALHKLNDEFVYTDQQVKQILTVIADIFKTELS